VNSAGRHSPLARLRPITEIARFTLQEAVSRRLILAGVAISVLFIGLFALGFNFAHARSIATSSTAEERVSLSVAFAFLTLFGVYVVNYLASFLAVFLAVGAVSGEVESGTLHAVLARPLRRADFILGRWLGYVTMLCVYIVAMVAMVLLVARLIADYTAPEPMPAVVLMLLEGVLLLSTSLLGSTLLPTLANGIVMFTLLGVAWLAGILEFVGRLLQQAPDATGSDALLNLGTAVSLLLPSDALWRGASYYLQSPFILAAFGATRAGIPFFSDVAPAPALIWWAIGYVLLALLGSILAFSRRDL